ncbi:predicted protein [Lichtheimia corymbifera JMRC:FSU:9682]|uniref:Uncharacterized protein n=1 Tax=Lichtheimia corymbifera JMRC:FSU:9682 TaxID=1263082 RepID=A0A068RI59_9FUNG|nr:predicted protein [Lichtheimia corymbifera JMRC:FSU:9682]
MDAIKSSDEISWNVALVTWRVIRMNDHMNTAEDDDDGLDGMDYILAKGALQPWMLSGYSSQIMQQSWLWRQQPRIQCWLHSIIPVDST